MDDWRENLARLADLSAARGVPTPWLAEAAELSESRERLYAALLSEMADLAKWSHDPTAAVARGARLYDSAEARVQALADRWRVFVATWGDEVKAFAEVPARWDDVLAIIRGQAKTVAAMGDLARRAVAGEPCEFGPEGDTDG
jgi:hypothetical protein